MSPGTNGQVFGELMATGAVMSGRRTFELAGRWHGDHHDGVPVHVLTHHVDEGDVPPGSAKFYTDVVACGPRSARRRVRSAWDHPRGASSQNTRETPDNRLAARRTEQAPDTDVCRKDPSAVLALVLDDRSPRDLPDADQEGSQAIHL
jgi:hypothetical protein